MEGMECNHFITILLLDPYFKINCWIYKSILEVLIKKLLNLISLSPIPPNFEMKIWGFKRIEKNEYSFLRIPFHSFPLKLPNKGMSFPFPPLKLSNKKKEEYSKIIPFHFILFPSPKRGLKWHSFGVYLGKIKHISMMMYHLTT